MRTDQEYKPCGVRHIQTTKNSKRYYHQVLVFNKPCGFSFHSFHFFLSVVNALSDKVGENGIRLGGGVRFLDMQLQERQYILVIIVNSYQFMYLHVCLSAMVYVKNHHSKMNNIHNRSSVRPVVELHTTNHINN